MSRCPRPTKGALHGAKTAASANLPDGSPIAPRIAQQKGPHSFKEFLNSKRRV
jgi:hypothetical protein